MWSCPLHTTTFVWTHVLVENFGQQTSLVRLPLLPILLLCPSLQWHMRTQLSSGRVFIFHTPLSQRRFGLSGSGPQFHEKTPPPSLPPSSLPPSLPPSSSSSSQREKKSENGAREGKNERNFGPPHPSGSTLDPSRPLGDSRRPRRVP